MNESALPRRLREARILFVGGKGGVGKTTTASAIALRASEEGRRILLVSTDPAHSLGDVFDASLGDREKEIRPNLHVLEIDPEREVDRYLEGVKATMRGFVRPAMYSEVERQIELTRHSPGASEAAMLERISRIMYEARDGYDQVIFDTAPTGHTLRLLALPEIMAAWMDGLLRSRDRADSFGKALDRLGARKRSSGEGSAAEVAEEGPDRTEGVETGADPEAGPTGERDRPGDELSWFDEAEAPPKDPRTNRIRELLLDRRRAFTRARRLLLDSGVTAFVLVLVPEKLPILETEKALEVLERHSVPVAGLVVNRVLPEGPLGDFLESRRAQEAEYLERIDRGFRRLPRIRVPLLARDVEGDQSLREVAGHLFIESA